VKDRALIDLARSLPFADPPSDHVEEMRTAVLASMGRHSSRPARLARRAWMIGGLGLAAAASIAFVLVHRAPEVSAPVRTHASVMAVGTATFARLSPIPDEVIRLTDGMLHLDVSPLAAGERCRVVVGDGEVEVRGTAFEVEARGDHLVRVAVAHGRVDVRVAGVLHVLGGGEHWEAPGQISEHTPTTVEIVDPHPVALVPAPVPAPRRSRAATLTTPREPSSPALAAPVVTAGGAAEREFRGGWSLLQGGDAIAAAAAFDRAIKLAPAGSVAEDAGFWRGAALVKAGKPELARHALVTFLAEFPLAVRGREAAAMLGWLLVDAGDLDAAEQQFQRAATDPVTRVRTSAESGLAEIARRRGP
jgi:hypothetical protein